MRKDIYRSYKAHLRCKKRHEKKYNENFNNWKSAIFANYHDRCAWALKKFNHPIDSFTKQKYLRNAEMNTYFD